MKGPKYYTEWINIVDGYFKSLSPDVATYEFGTSFVVMGVLTVAYCITNKQESVINKMANHLPEVIAIFFGFSFTLMTIIGQIKENVKGDSKKQKLYREFEKSEKIIWGLTADKWAYTLDTEQHYLPSNAYILTSDTIPIRFILGLLNSKLLHYYFGFIGVMTAGGAYTLKAATIEAFPIAIGTREQQKEIAAKVESILNAKAKDKQADVSSIESEIDHLVYNLYGLSDNEIKIVEGV